MIRLSQQTSREELLPFFLHALWFPELKCSLFCFAFCRPAVLPEDRVGSVCDLFTLIPVSWSTKHSSGENKEGSLLHCTDLWRIGLPSRLRYNTFIKDFCYSEVHSDTVPCRVLTGGKTFPRVPLVLTSSHVRGALLCQQTPEAHLVKSA